MVKGDEMWLSIVYWSTFFSEDTATKCVLNGAIATWLKKMRGG